MKYFLTKTHFNHHKTLTFQTTILHLNMTSKKGMNFFNILIDIHKARKDINENEKKFVEYKKALDGPKAHKYFDKWIDAQKELELVTEKNDEFEKCVKEKLSKDKKFLELVPCGKLAECELDDIFFTIRRAFDFTTEQILYANFIKTGDEECTNYCTSRCTTCGRCRCSCECFLCFSSNPIKARVLEILESFL